MESKLDLTSIRAQFPTLRAPGASAYLDSASSSLTPEPVLAAMDEYYRAYRANVHRGLYRASEQATQAFEDARAKVARFIGAQPKEVVFTRGTTESLNMVAHGLEHLVGVGDEIVLTVAEHHANLVPWQQLATRTGAALRFVPLTKGLAIDADAFRAALSPRTKVVALQWASNVLGTVHPLEALLPLVRAAAPDAFVVVDAAQMAGHRRMDVAKLGADFVAFSGHKMYGPTGIGVLWGRMAALEQLAPTTFGGDMIDEVTLTSVTWADVPRRFEAGTQNIAGAIGLGAAVDFLSAVDFKALAKHEQELATYAAEKLSAIPGVTAFVPSGDRLGIVSFSVDGIHPHDVATVLDGQGVAVRAGFHCAMPLCQALGAERGLTRMSLGMYSTREDIDKLAAGIVRAQQTLLV
jgi:cysteine desulfurase/selenocysteine lyase